jgi:carboxypeptidase family protein
MGWPGVVSRMNLRNFPLRASWMTAGLLAGLFCLPGSAPAASPVPLSAEILGQVRSSAGVAQMGAAVSLYNRYDELVRKGLTNEQGRFVFDSLAPGLYSIRVLLASFVPAERRNISVLPNTENRLDISLASVLSTVELGPPAAPGTLMTDDWKWVLRSSQATRPVLRFLPDGASSSSRSLTAAFSNTTGIVKLSAGDGEGFTSGAQQDLGTAFALATSLAGSGRVQLSGNLGYRSNAGLPAAGFRTSYSRPSVDGPSPEVILTMRQLSVAPRGGSGMAVGADGAPALRTMSVAFLDGLDLADHLRLDYGFDSQSISYLDRLNYVSPFMRVSYDAGPQGRVRLAYSSGAHPTELRARDSDSPESLDQDLATLALLPRVSLSDGHVAVERTQNFEIGYERVEGSRAYSLGAYQENVSNAAFMLSSAPNFLPAGDLLPDLGSNSTIFNLGSYHRTGYTAAVKQSLGEHVQVSVAAGRTGVLLAGGNQSFADSRELRAGVRQGERPWLTVRVSGTVPRTGTHLTGDYGWTDFSALMPAHFSLTQTPAQDTGWNMYIRQPLPSVLNVRWRVEATAELRNMLAQGYLPLGGPACHTVLTNSPRAVRGGLNFIF